MQKFRGKLRSTLKRVSCAFDVCGKQGSVIIVHVL